VQQQLSSRRLVFVDPAGQLQSTTDNVIDLQQQILKNVQLDPTSVIYGGNGVLPSFAANSFYLQPPPAKTTAAEDKKKSATVYSLLGHSVQTGEVIPLAGVAQYDPAVSTLDMTAVTLTKLSKVSVSSLHILPTPAAASAAAGSVEVKILGINKDGLVITPSDTITLSSSKVSITQDLILSKGPKITLLSATTSASAGSNSKPRVLGVDSQGVLIIMKKKIKTRKEETVKKTNLKMLLLLL